MDQCTHEVRAEYWKRIIRACGQRPAGQSAKSWMEENGICEQSYYHWQRKFRQQAYGQMKASAPMNLSEVTVVSLYISEELTIPHGQSDHLSRRFRSLISERNSL